MEVYVLKVRIKFSKTGPLKFIGHLDVMRYFQKLFRRAQIPVKYSEGFSPHQLLSFSHPLPLGMESLGEYADIELTESICSKEAINRLSVESVPFIKILSFKMLPEKSENAMACVSASKYEISFMDSCPCKNLKETVDNLLAKSEIIVYKKTKKSEKFENIRPFIYEINVSSDNSKFEILLSSGSVNNVKPELVLNAIEEAENINFDKDSIKITRIDQYTFEEDKLISLDEIGSNIE